VSNINHPGAVHEGEYVIPSKNAKAIADWYESGSLRRMSPPILRSDNRGRLPLGQYGVRPHTEWLVLQTPEGLRLIRADSVAPRPAMLTRAKSWTRINTTEELAALVGSVVRLTPDAHTDPRFIIGTLLAFEAAPLAGAPRIPATPVGRLNVKLAGYDKITTEMVEVLK
jgi:hypothetical protein